MDAETGEYFFMEMRVHPQPCMMIYDADLAGILGCRSSIQ